MKATDTGAPCLHPSGRRKLTYRSRAAANRAHRVNRKDGLRLYPYECSRCGLWHVSKHA
jgi:hypothetical protein